MNRKRDREFGSVSFQETDRILSDRQNLHDYREREARGAPQAESIAQRTLSDAEMERDGGFGIREILIGWLCMESTVNF